MVNIISFEGITTKEGLFVKDALKTIDNILLNNGLNRITCSSLFNEDPLPGSYAPRTYNLVSSNLNNSINNQGQVDIPVFLRRMSDAVRRLGPDVLNKYSLSLGVFITDKDLTNSEHGLNYCFGETGLDKDYIILSNNRVRQDYFFKHLAFHELGHYFGACSIGRVNTVDSLGTHCINDLCVMQQKLSVPEAINYAKLRHASNARPYCNDCVNDIINWGRLMKQNGFTLDSQYFK